MKPIILASTAPHRKAMLEQVGLNVVAVPSNYEEDLTLAMSPKALVKYLSAGKAESVAKKYKNAIVIAADTIVAYKKEIFGKPHTAARARQMLKKLSGKTHSILTGFTIIDTGRKKKISRVVETIVTFKKLSASDIESYIATGEPLNRGGSYAIQGRAAAFIKKIEGDYFNIVGLPVFEVCATLQKEFGIRVA